MLKRFASLQANRLQILLATALWVSVLPNLAPLKGFYLSPSAGAGLQALAFAMGGWLFVLLVTFSLLMVLSLVFWGRAIKLLSMLFLLWAGLLSFYTLFLGVQFDRVMAMNMMQTYPAEALELFNFRLLAWFLLVGVLPAFVLYKVRLVPRKTSWQQMLSLLAVWLGLVVVTALVIFSMYSRYASAIRGRDATFESISPANLVVASAHYAYLLRESKQVKKARGLDAKRKYPLAKPRLVVLVLGETARAQNQGLNGYGRDTTPRMKAAGGIYFPDALSCGTATTISVPCSFSGFSRQDFSLSEARNTESLVDVLSHAGVRVIWRDNDSGCKGVCDKADFTDFTNAKNAKWCLEAGNCFDEILLEGLEDKVRAESKDTFLVLHVKGSHGPSYYKRYPSAFERFKPTCQSSDLSSCDRQVLINGYDNTILYTDHVVGEVIDMMNKVSDQFATAVVYVSDHGESLGESGLYLHGMPYALAPKEQTHVPLYAWVSPQYLQMEKWNVACLKNQAKIQRSHDNIYPTVLGFLEIATAEYKRDLDIFAACDPKVSP